MLYYFLMGFVSLFNEEIVVFKFTATGIYIIFIHTYLETDLSHQ